METNTVILQEELKRILFYFDDLCNKYNIKYSLYGGTLLGAVRGQGFIPWDDDVDVFLMRDEYERFLKIWECENHEGLFLQEIDTDPYWRQPIAKIRKIDSTYIEYDYQKNWPYNGIFIDIYPVDRIGDDFLSNKLGHLLWLIYLFTYKGFMIHMECPRNNSIFEWIKKTYRDMFRRHLVRISGNHKKRLGVISGVSRWNFRLPRDMFESYTKVFFEGRMLSSIEDWDTYLSQEYGRYMELPPIEDRVPTHHPIYVNLTKHIDANELDSYSNII